MKLISDEELMKGILHDLITNPDRWKGFNYDKKYDEEQKKSIEEGYRNVQLVYPRLKDPTKHLTKEESFNEGFDKSLKKVRKEFNLPLKNILTKDDQYEIEKILDIYAGWITDNINKLCKTALLFDGTKAMQEDKFKDNPLDISIHALCETREVIQRIRDKLEKQRKEDGKTKNM